MDDIARAQLVEMTELFYEAHADSFDESRSSGWNSWDRVANAISSMPGPVSVLDLGCGNGRFLMYLNERGIADIEYTGIDTSKSLIDLAAERFPDHHFECDSLQGFLETSSRFDVVVCFGVMHHIPDIRNRVRVLQQASDYVAKEGLLVVSFWQPMLLPGFESKVLKDHDYEFLEENDFLMGWKGDFSQLRYVHHFDNHEIDTLILGSRLSLSSQFQGDGNDASNRYVILSN